MAENCFWLLNMWKRVKHHGNLENRMVLVHKDLFLIVIHVEMAQTPQKLEQSHDYGQ